MRRTLVASNAIQTLEKPDEVHHLIVYSLNYIQLDQSATYKLGSIYTRKKKRQIVSQFAISRSLCNLTFNPDFRYGVRTI